MLLLLSLMAVCMQYICIAICCICMMQAYTLILPTLFMGYQISFNACTVMARYCLLFLFVIEKLVLQIDNATPPRLNTAVYNNTKKVIINNVDRRGMVTVSSTVKFLPIRNYLVSFCENIWTWNILWILLGKCTTIAPSL